MSASPLHQFPTSGACVSLSGGTVGESEANPHLSVEGKCHVALGSDSTQDFHTEDHRVICATRDRYI